MNEYLKGIDKEIRQSYKGIISDEQIEATIKWWHSKITGAIQELQKSMPNKEDINKVHEYFKEDKADPENKPIYCKCCKQRKNDSSTAYDYIGGKTQGWNDAIDQVQDVFTKWEEK